MKGSTVTCTAIFAGLLCAAPLAAAAPTTRDGAHDFDFNMGSWSTHVERLSHPLRGSHDWLAYDGTSVVRPVWGGHASIFELEVSGPAGRIEGVGLRLYDPQTRQWSLNWASARDGLMTPPMFGTFHDGIGEFVDRETYDGKPIMVRNRFLAITANSSRFEQAFSADQGRTWETNWIMTFTRADKSARP